jgi:hypothetical protein
VSTKPKAPGEPFDYGATRPDGQHEHYPVLSAEERAQGFVRPVFREYKHLKYGAITRMGLDLCETYARQPTYYGATFCVSCRGHHPVGPEGEFVWIGLDGKETTLKVGC